MISLLFQNWCLDTGAWNLVPQLAVYDLVAIKMLRFNPTTQTGSLVMSSISLVLPVFDVNDGSALSIDPMFVQTSIVLRNQSILHEP